LERIGHRVTSAAAAVFHPIGTHSPDFWPVWRRFVERNAAIDVQLRRGVTATPALPAPAAEQQPSDMPADVKERLGLTGAPIAAQGALQALHAPVVLDNGANITLIRTVWGEDEAHVEYEGEGGVSGAGDPMVLPESVAPRNDDGGARPDTLRDACRSDQGPARRLGKAAG
jgi:hypothetical protein